MTTTEHKPQSSGPWPFTLCPDCGSHDFVTRRAGDDVVFTCVGCAASWRYLLGYLVSVPDPSFSPSER